MAELSAHDLHEKILETLKNGEDPKPFGVKDRTAIANNAMAKQLQSKGLVSLCCEN